KYHPAASGMGNINKVVGGARVKFLLSGTPSAVTSCNRYFYGTVATPDVSSLSEIPTYIYNRDIMKAITCQAQLGAGSSPGPYLGLCRGKAMYSSSIVNIFDYSGSPISYSSVVESKGQDFEGGGIQTSFLTRSDAKGVIKFGQDIIGAPLTNFSAFMNGNIKDKLVFKKTSTGTVIPLNKEAYTYKYDAADQLVVSGLSVEKRYTPGPYLPLSNCPPQTAVVPSLMGAYNAIRYDMLSYWVYNDTLTETFYDENGLNPITKQTVNIYGNTAHHNLTSRKTIGSKNEQIITEYKYPHELSSIPIHTTMISKNIIDKVVLVNTFSDLVKTSATKLNYSDAGNGNITLQSIQKSYLDDILLTESTIDFYDVKGNITQYTTKAGVSAVIWGGSNCQYPVAKIVGATYSQAIASLTVTPAGLCALDENGLRSQIQLIRNSLPNARVETYTYKNNVGITSVTDVNNNLTTYLYDNKDRLLTHKDKDGNIVKQFEYYLDPTTDRNIDVFFNDPISQSFTCQKCLSSYAAPAITYSIPAKRYFSVNSVAEANVKAVTALNQLGQAYADNTAICSKGTFNFYNTVKSGVFTRSDCGTNYTGSQVTYTIAAGAYTGPTQYDADALAQYYLNVNGPTYANTNGTCAPTCNTSTCSGVDKKCVSGACQTGMKIYTSSVQVHGSLWDCTYHYEWSDGTWSANYTEQKPTSCMNFE
ncbi:MAG: DUF5977 domain-containing protein, partial [Ferruginibacter sp.]